MKRKRNQDGLAHSGPGSSPLQGSGTPASGHALAQSSARIAPSQAPSTPRTKSRQVDHNGYGTRHAVTPTPSIKSPRATRNTASATQNAAGTPGISHQNADHTADQEEPSPCLLETLVDKTPALARPKIVTGASDSAHAVTPKTSGKAHSGNTTSVPMQLADRSARKKSSRRLIEKAAVGSGSDDEELDGNGDLARKVLGEDDSEGVQSDTGLEPDGNEDTAHEPAEAAPVKRGRGRPKGSKRKRTPTPPRELPAHEHYFFQNRPTGGKTSNNTFSSTSLPTHEEYFEFTKSYIDPHEPEKQFLQSLHSQSFDQWIFELEECFSICLYGWGSKRDLLDLFAEYLYFSKGSKQPPKIVVVRGYDPAVSIRDILATFAGAIPSLAAESTQHRLGAQPSDVLNTILDALTASPPTQPITLLIHSIDAPPLRRPISQALISRLVSSAHVRLVASADTPNFPLLWDITLKSQFNFVFHDVTTFQSFDTELAATGGGVVDQVNALIGRSGRNLGGKEGVVFVLKSLTENARRLFALLIAEILSLDEEDEEINVDGTLDDDDDDDDEFEMALRKPASNVRSALSGGVEYNSFYRKAMSQLIATSETAFRTLLKEFHDHEMLVNRKDASGAELLSVPFRKEECQAILEEMVLD